MRRSDIRVGGFYTKNDPLFAREVIGDDGSNFIYRDFSLTDGQPISTRSQCGHASFASWAHRECTPEEKARCDVAAMERNRREESDRLSGMLEVPVMFALYKVLDAIKTEYVVKYLQDKGYEVAKREPAAADNDGDEGARGG